MYMKINIINIERIFLNLKSTQSSTKSTITKGDNKRTFFVL